VRGYAVFQPNFRGSTGSGNALLEAGKGQWGRKMQSDLSDGVAELARQGVINSNRACIVGGSYGGYAALAGVTLQHGLYRCAVAYAGVSDVSAQLEAIRDRTGRVSAATRMWKAYLGGATSEISPVRFADKADAPILLIHGADDTVVPLAQSAAMESALRRARKPVEFVTLPDADHWLLRQDARVAMVTASVSFVLKNNPPDPPLGAAPSR
jgi:dipeptidyl aminopeptidase/acylaminoacyl peptidase